MFKVGEGHFGVNFNSRNLPKTQNSDHRNENNSMKHPKRIKSSREARWAQSKWGKEIYQLSILNGKSRDSRRTVHGYDLQFQITFEMGRCIFAWYENVQDKSTEEWTKQSKNVKSMFLMKPLA